MTYLMHRSYYLIICLMSSRTLNAYMLTSSYPSSIPQLRAHSTVSSSSTTRDMTITRAIRSREGVAGVTTWDVSQCSGANAAEHNNESESTLTPSLRTRRPHNSYLKIIMNDAVSRDLYSLTHQLKHRWDGMESLNSSSSSDERELEAMYKVTSDKSFQPCIGDSSTNTQHNQLQPDKSKPNLKIKTRSLQSLHMTYFFCGTMLSEMPSEQLILFNSMLHEKLRTINNKDGAYGLQFKSNDLFPPQRLNLFVATFEASPALNTLYEDLCDIAMTPKGDTEQDDDDKGDKHTFAQMQREYEFPLLRSAVFKEVKKRRRQQQKRNTDSSFWMPHITLANIVGGKNSGIKQLNEWLSGQSFKIDADTRIPVQGLDLGGPYPQQVDLDWSFQFDVGQR